MSSNGNCAGSGGIGRSGTRASSEERKAKNEKRKTKNGGERLPLPFFVFSFFAFRSRRVSVYVDRDAPCAFCCRPCGGAVAWPWANLLSRFVFRLYRSSVS